MLSTRTARPAAAHHWRNWSRPALSAALKEVLAAHKLKMPQLAMPLRLALTGQLQTPAIDAVMALFGRETVLARLANYVA